jgi:hypothetical protein
MRYAPLSGELRNIRRVEYDKKGRKGSTRLWQVHFTLKNRAPISQSFSDSTYGGKETALLWAKRFRNAVEHELAAAETLFGKTGTTNPEAEIGISRSCSKRVTGGRTKVWWYWQATWPTVGRKPKNRKFHDLKCGGSEEAKRRAIAARQAGIELYRAQREGSVALDDPLPDDAYGDSRRAPYTLFMPPQNLDIPVWRYMDFTKFVSLLQNGGLYFPAIADLNDTFEGSFGGGNQVLRPMIYRHFPSDHRVTAGELVQRLRNWVTASCWHMNAHESAAMWKLYARTDEAVCIQSTFRRLRETLGDAAKVGVVRYVDYETEWIPESNPLAPFLYKRKSFEHEHEVRAILPLGDPNQLKNVEKPRVPSERGHWVAVDLPRLIQRIYVAPDSPDWFHALVKAVAEKYQENAIPVVKSALSQAPIY